MKLCVFTVATHSGGHFTDLLQSCRCKDVQPVVLKPAVPYCHGQKIVLARHFALEHWHEFSHFLFCDAFDVILAADAVEILLAFERLASPIVFSAERSCSPDRLLRWRYPKAETPYRFLNSGLWMGETKAVREMFQSLQSPAVGGEPSCQRIYTNLFLHGKAPIALDYHCHLFQSLYWSDFDLEWDSAARRVRNRITGTHPCAFHGNGRSNLDQVIRWQEEAIRVNNSITANRRTSTPVTATAARNRAFSEQALPRG